MASIAETLIKGVQQTTEGFGDDFQQAANLGLKIQGMKQQREKLQQQKAQINAKKLENIGTQFNGLSGSKSDIEAKFRAKSLAATLNSTFGNIHPELENLLVADRNAQNEMKFALENMLAQSGGEFDDTQMQELAQQFQAGGPEVLDRVREFNTTIRKEREAEKRARLVAEGQAARQAQTIEAAKERQETGIRTAGQKSADIAFGKEVATYDPSVVQKNVKKLKSAVALLKEPGEIGKSKIAGIPVIGGDLAQDFFAPKMSKVRDQIRGAIQATLRQTLGSQFTAQEGEAIFNRAFNPRLSDAENIERATAEIEALEAQAKAKESRIKHFQKTGTLTGFQAPGTAPTTGIPGLPRLTPAILKRLNATQIEALEKKTGMTLPQIKRALGVK